MFKEKKMKFKIRIFSNKGLMLNLFKDNLKFDEDEILLLDW